MLLSGSNNRATVTATATALRNEMIEFGFQLEKYAKRDAKIMQIAAAAAAAATATAATSNIQQWLPQLPLLVFTADRFSI